MAKITITLTPYQAKILWGVVDGAADAGACEGGNTQQETDALIAVTDKLLDHHEKWKDAE